MRGVDNGLFYVLSKSEFLVAFFLFVCLFITVVDCDSSDKGIWLGIM